jgi:hypothetical protein
MASPNASIFAIRGKSLGSLGYELLTRPSLQLPAPSKTAQVPQNYYLLTHPSLQSGKCPFSHPGKGIWSAGSGWFEGYVSFGFIRVSLTIGLPITGATFQPLSLAQFLIERVIGVCLHLVSLPGRLLRPLTLNLFARGLILVPGAGIEKIATINAKDLIHDHFLLIRENGIA